MHLEEQRFERFSAVVAFKLALAVWMEMTTLANKKRTMSENLHLIVMMSKCIQSYCRFRLGSVYFIISLIRFN